MKKVSAKMSRTGKANEPYLVAHFSPCPTKCPFPILMLNSTEGVRLKVHVCICSNNLYKI